MVNKDYPHNTQHFHCQSDLQSKSIVPCHTPVQVNGRSVGACSVHCVRLRQVSAVRLVFHVVASDPTYLPEQDWDCVMAVGSRGDQYASTQTKSTTAGHANLRQQKQKICHLKSKFGSVPLKRGAYRDSDLRSTHGQRQHASSEHGEFRPTRCANPPEQCGRTLPV